MNSKLDMINKLSATTAEVVQFIESMHEEQLFLSANGKWNALEQLEHLNKSVRPLNWAFRLPKFLLGIYFGKANRPSKTYEELAAKYLAKLQVANPTVNPFGPAKHKTLIKEKLLKNYRNYNQLFIQQIQQTKEEDLDKYILPHPLLGKITLREMVYFTIYHNYHHLQLINQLLHG